MNIQKGFLTLSQLLEVFSHQLLDVTLGTQRKHFPMEVQVTISVNACLNQMHELKFEVFQILLSNLIDSKLGLLSFEDILQPITVRWNLYVAEG